LDAVQLAQVLAEQQGHGQSTRVREQVFNGDIARALNVERGQVLRDVVVQLDLPVIDQHQDGGPDQGLGHRAHAEDAADLHGHLRLAVAPAVGLVQDRVSVFDDEELGADDLLVVDEALDEVAEGHEHIGRHALRQGV
jgi:hypothetical protein